MIRDTKPHTFGSAREMTPEEKEFVDAAFKGLRVENPRIEELKQQLREKDSRIAGLEKALDYAGVKLLGHKDRRAYEYVDKVLCEDGPQRLAEIQADAVEVNLPAKKHVPEDTPSAKYALGWNDMIREMRLRADQLRNEAKG